MQSLNGNKQQRAVEWVEKGKHKSNITTMTS